MNYWLMKTEPELFGIADLERLGISTWDGVRSFQARNIMRDLMSVGDGVLFYHSNAKPSGVAGTARIARAAYPDHTAWDQGHRYYDAKTDPENPRWLMVDVAFAERFADVVPLAELKSTPSLADMMVVKRGMRLSIQPVSEAEWHAVIALGRSKVAPAPAKEAPRRRRGGGKKRPKKAV